MQLPKVYEPSQYESDIYALWEKGGSFLPTKGESKRTFSIAMPPPNANGDLHLGHALTVAIEDILIRYHRLKGDSTVFLPGADHAGFETWVVYEKSLAKQGKTRFDFSREELYSQVWDFVQLNKGNFESQMRSLGASCDWTRFTFTLDNKVVDRSYKTFKKLWDDKLIYRGERLVNFCTHHGTSFSDIEVVYKDVPGFLWHINYPLTDGSGHITVATTRPETMLGDTAVAVHPSDERYAEFVGKTIKLPLTNREIPIIADEMVDKEFGSGAVKITPAHDQNDYEVAGRHDLPFITVIDHEGKMTHQTPASYRGKDVQAARKLIVDDLVKLKVLDRIEEYAHSVGHCYKCDTVIEPLLREQWFIDMKPLAADAIKAIKAGKITFYPASKKNQLIAYLENIRDWNISRQIAWGIPIPAFQNVDDSDDWIYDERVTEETIEVGKKTYRRDPDVFDTWFSSGQWPYVTLGYPDEDDYKKFYPLSVMETGFDILLPWVSRMVMLGLYITGKSPFEDVYLHGLILDEHGQKMSKSKGNVVNPMDVLQAYGSDALRIGIISGQTPGNNQPFGKDKVIGGRNFCNKLWNVARFIESSVDDFAKVATHPQPKTEADEWILTKLQQSSLQISELLDKYRFSEAFEVVHKLLWDDFADWYIEASKVERNESALAYALETILKLAHPFAPFVTEAIWQTLHPDDETQLITTVWPDVAKSNEQKAKEFEELQHIISEIRFIDSVIGLRHAKLYHKGEKFLQTHAEIIKRMAKISDVKEVSDGQGLNLTQTTYNCWLDVDSQSAQNFLKQLQVKQQEQAKVVAQLQSRLDNKAYVKNAPKAVVEQTKTQLSDAQKLLEKLSVEYNRFNRGSA